MKKQLIAIGAFLVLAIGALPSLAACPCQSYQSSYYTFPTAPCCCGAAAPIASPCCPAVKPCCPLVKPCCEAVKPCCPSPCAKSCPCGCAAPIQKPCCEEHNTCNDCCD